MRILMKNGKEKLDKLGDALVTGFEIVALFVIGATIAWSAVHDYLDMIRAGRARLDDILLLFIYVELGTMVGIYFKTDRLPVRFLLYVAITAMTRFLAVDIKELPIESILVVTASILVLTLAVLVLEIATSKFATSNSHESSKSLADEAMDRC
jgi:phosphate starvation-inducible membrane PsiE